MLQILNIENVALIDRATLNFDEKLNVISGETGAGKSILLDSLSFVFGGRADRSLIRSGENSMKVEAIFSSISSKQIEYIKSNFDIDCVDELFISRELDLNGKNTCKINGELVPVATVKTICSLLVDIHGQTEHLAILDNDYQLKILDLFGKTPKSVFVELEALINEFKENEKQIKLLGGDEEEKQNLIDLYKYQIQEIENAKIQEGEFENLLEEKKEMSQFEKINDNLKTAYGSISKNGFGESSIEQVNSALKSLQNIENVNEHYQELYSRIKSCLIELQDISDTVYDDLNNNVFDEQRFNYVDSRIDFIKTLFRKYGGNYENLINYYDDVSKKLENLFNSAEKYNKLIIEKEKILEKIEKVQNKLSEIRKESAKKLSSETEQELKILGMPNARMDIQFSRINEQFSLFGYDFVEFMFSANLGFELKPLNKVVSGGEMSRVMLAYKILLSTVDDIHTIVFDEIDSGLSGNIATVVAEYMARLSLNKQILAVSHLPQICAMADRNIIVSKSSTENQTRSQSVVLTGEELLCEIARLMGAALDDKGLMVSADLKEKSENYKKQLKK
ncbi:MAG: DNA repair protein RecN [Clostridia bacterium]|nr:DNA repair protein RecN [Clostridia bacterium]